MTQVSSTGVCHWKSLSIMQARMWVQTYMQRLLLMQQCSSQSAEAVESSRNSPINMQHAGSHVSPVRCLGLILQGWYR